MDGRLRYTAGFLAGGGDTPSPTPAVGVYHRTVTYNDGTEDITVSSLVNEEGKLLVFDSIHGNTEQGYFYYDSDEEGVTVGNELVSRLTEQEWAAKVAAFGGTVSIGAVVEDTDGGYWDDFTYNNVTYKIETGEGPITPEVDLYPN